MGPLYTNVKISVLLMIWHLWHILILRCRRNYITKLEAVSSKLGLNINTDNTKTIRISSNTREQIMINSLGIDVTCNDVMTPRE